MRTDADNLDEADGWFSLPIYALSLWQPWATLWAAGLKTVETRSWSTSVRGAVLIHASSKWDGTLAKLCLHKPFRIALQQLGFMGLDGEFLQPLPRGAIIGAADIVAIERTEGVRDSLSATEKSFGDYASGRFAWRSTNARTFLEPVAARGALKFWQPTSALRERCLFQLGRTIGEEASNAGARA